MINSGQSLFDVQPEWCRQPLQEKQIVWGSKRIDFDKVAFFDPTELYLRLAKHIKPYKRIQSISMGIFWPNDKGFCACGCGSQLTGRQTRWASGHNGEPEAIYRILYGTTSTIYFYLAAYHGEKCACCNRTSREVIEQDIRGLPSWSFLHNVAPLKVDHIFPVKLGGGGGWLSNYQLLCHKCHVKKTNEDFGWNRPSLTIQTSLF
ncbi:MAG: HNH endonuclease [Cyclobacteriaceae bacterium]